ncbi:MULTISPECIES: hypothetical protein [Enterobacteriaceae]|nr:hypothetical protein [Escherichia coli]EBQ9667346.1 hypothetical protein [Salmonella enterica subsp. enterica serovar Enteritidis]ECI8207271.1 hypothetical protein [Salmonella enterica subsp. enterica]EJI6252416.1 hypothetical protein [Salmonella enterica]HAX0146735.1 hypothetical protein [Escherichia coli JJ2087]EBU9994472.1 hypothetical protein [Salmonella enterica subsp. enterica serovar Enteritidis]
MSRVVIELNEGYKKAACAAHSHWLIVYFTLPTFITFPTKLDSLRFSFAASVNRIKITKFKEATINKCQYLRGRHKPNSGLCTIQPHCVQLILRLDHSQPVIKKGRWCGIIL